jgi:hypothetical protein
MRVGVIAVVASLVIARGAAAQLATSPAANPLGTWRGSSRCVARQSACKDETVVYRIARKGLRDSLLVDARKVVAGQEEDMGSLACQINASRALITCAIPTGKWRFRVRHDSLVGQLRLEDGTWFRDVLATRSRDGKQ